ncbi:MAG TPA: hypothetical protein VLW17_06710 [Thermoanaerobaculaceae bacterium]|nr:hypothetical protein [Thermoanaerobaculaceae bacterium]
MPTPAEPNQSDAREQRAALYAAPIWTWRLWGLRDRRLELAATALTLAALAASRFALLPSGPWEWDETLFARGLLRFDMPSHFPHPPGFPLWMALGWLAMHFVSEPLRGLQLLSGLASCLTLFPLAALGRRVAPAPVAAAAALALLFSPAVWLHAARGFTDTPATLFALWAAALAVGGLAGRRAGAFTLLVTAAFLIRPVLLPPFGLLWLAGALAVRPRRRLLPGVALGAAAVALAAAGLLVAQGSWSDFLSAFAVHAETHARNLVEHNPGGLLDLGMLTGIGGGWLALAMAVVAGLGLVVWRRRTGWRTAAAWLVVITVLAAQLVWLQNRRFARYAVPLHLALAPLAAGAAAAAAPPAAAAAALAALGAAWAGLTYPAVAEQHRTLLPGWAAVRAAVAEAKRDGFDVLVEPGLHPFLSYAEELDRSRGETWRFKWFLGPTSPDSRDLPGGPFILLTDYPFHYFPPLAGVAQRFDGVSDRLRELTPGRFLDTEVAPEEVVPVHGWWLPETSPESGDKFIWGTAGADLLVPTIAGGRDLAIDLVPYPGPAPLIVLVDGREAATVAGDARRGETLLGAAWFRDERAVRVTFRRAEAYAPGGGDERRLAVKVFGFRLVRAPFPNGQQPAGD